MAVRYMVALDGSDGAATAFNTALLLLNKDRGDEIYLLAAVEPLPFQFIKRVKELNNSVVDYYKEVLLDFGARCREAKLKYHLTLIKGSHTGAAICSAVNKKQIDFLVMGRRGLNPFTRLVLGSTSKYCMEHANANVLVIKGSYLPEEHCTLKEITEAEEAERQRRIEEAQGTLAEKLAEKKDREAAHIGAVIDEEQERKRRVFVERGDEKENAEIEKERKEAAKIGAVIDEETERKRRIEEIEKEERHRRKAAHIGAVVAEEEERKRRIEEERVIDDRTRHVQMFELFD